MEDSKEKKDGLMPTKNDRNEWVAPEITVLTTGSTSGGSTTGIAEGGAYHS